jgi:hypothetical protein
MNPPNNPGGPHVPPQNNPGGGPHVPPQFLWNPSQISNWGCDKYPLAVVAEEAFAKACYKPEIFITDATVVTWATKNNVLYGGDIGPVLSLMMQDGFHQDGKIYCNGSFSQVNWNDEQALQSAIFQGPVKAGIDPTSIQPFVGTGKKGWIATGLAATAIPNVCASLCGYGNVGNLAARLGAAVPSNIDKNMQAYAIFFMNSIGIIDAQSMKNIVGQAWLRTPTTVVK